MIEYIRDGAEIYRQSFATIRAEADLSAFPEDVSQAVVRMIHASGQVDLVDDVAFTPGVVKAARAALAGGAPILCDAQMVAAGVTRKRLPADNEVLCTLRDPRVPVLAEQIGNTRSAAADHQIVQSARVLDQRFLRLRRTDETDRTAHDRGGPGCTGFDHVQQVEQGGRGVADRDDGTLEFATPQFERGRRTGVPDLLR